jgi:succinate dehydrogenase/fumarate reductase flavoprotein subunit
MHISEIGLCSGHSGSGVWVDEHGRTTVAGLYAAGDMACVPHNYLLGAMTYGEICAESALADLPEALAPREPHDRAAADEGGQIAAERQRVLAPLSRPNGIPHHQIEYKIRRFVNDYLQPPKTATRMEIGLGHFLRARDELDEAGAREPHELMRVVEAGFIRDCAEMAARASLFRKESRWGLYHYRLDHPQLDDQNWFVHVNLRKQADGKHPDGTMTAFKRPVADYVVPLDAGERGSYSRTRVPAPGEPPGDAAPGQPAGEPAGEPPRAPQQAPGLPS